MGTVAISRHCPRVGRIVGDMDLEYCSVVSGLVASLPLGFEPFSCHSGIFTLP